MIPDLPEWALEIAGVSGEDEHQPSDLDGVNLVLNRRRVAQFLTAFAEDYDLQNFLTLDAVSSAAGLPLSSTGRTESTAGLSHRPFRQWEYLWLYKILNFAKARSRVLDLGGPATHLTILAAMAGCRVTSLDLNSDFVAAGLECAAKFGVPSFEARVGDMRDLSAFRDESFDAIVSCSVLEHLTGNDQETSLREMARVLRPGGMIGLTFDYGPSAAGANVYLSPPHDPPGDAAEVLRRFVQRPLVLAGNQFEENPIPGSLFCDETVMYTVASLFLAKPPIPSIQAPTPLPAGASTPDSPRVDRMTQHFYHTAVKNEKSRLQGEAWRIAAEERLSSMLEKETVIQEMHTRLTGRKRK